MIVAILIGIMIIVGIITVQDRFDEEGLGRALKSLFCLFMALIAVMFIFSGVGAIVGVPLLVCIGKFFAKGI